MLILFQLFYSRQNLVVYSKVLIFHYVLVHATVSDFALCTEILDDIMPSEAKKRRRVSKRRILYTSKHRGFALQLMEELDESQFQKMFRLSRHAFNCLVEKIKPIVGKSNGLRHNHDPSKVISPRTRLACTLRWLAGGSYIDICFAFGVPDGTFYQDFFLWQTILAIDAVLPDISLPVNDRAALTRLAEGFARVSNGIMSQCVMAMDGWVAQTRMPNAIEIYENDLSQMSFRNRKGIWGLVVFAGCDANLKFIMWSCKCPGSTNDCLAWAVTNVYNEVVCKGLLPSEYYFVCDEAVACDEIVLSPFGGQGIGIYKDSFNYHLSLMRQCIERAFGVLVVVWGILWRPLQIEFRRWTLILRVCAKLHNYRIDMKVSENSGTLPEDYAEGDSCDVVENPYNPENDGPRPSGAHNSSARRLRIVEELRNRGITRPRHAHSNSRA